MARTTTTTSAGTSTNRARMAASWGNTRYTNITTASRITLAARNPNAVISTGTIQIGLLGRRTHREFRGCGTCPGRVFVSIDDEIVADHGARRNRNTVSPATGSRAELPFGSGADHRCGFALAGSPHDGRVLERPTQILGKID